MNDVIDPTGKDWKTIGLQWLVSQGVSTVLLFCILAGGGYACYSLVPQHLQQIQKGYEDITERHERTVKAITDGHERTVKQLTESQDRERAAILNLVRRSREHDERGMP